MAQPYIGEIRLFAGNFAPVGWMFCEGQLVPISENEALFQLIGTTYGGDGEETFSLPDLRGRIPVHMSSNYQIGQSGGVEDVTLTTAQIPVHNHALVSSTSTGSGSTPVGSLLAKSTSKSMYRSGGSPVMLNAASVSPAGGSQPHSNMQPYLCINFIISLFGIFPSQT